MQRRTFIQAAGSAAATLGVPAWAPQALAASEGPLSARHITIGSTLALTGMLGGAGRDYVLGTNAAFAAVNKAGGIHGRELRLLAMDDAYVPKRTLENATKMIGGNEIFALLSVFGTANSYAILPMTEKEGVPFVAPVTGASSLRRKEQRFTFFVRPSYTDETVHALTLMADMGIRDVAVVYLDNAFGKEVLKDAERTFERLKLRSVGAFPLAVTGANGDEVAQKVIDAKAGGVFIATTGAATTSFVLPMHTRMPALPIAGVSVAVISSEIPKLGDAIKGVAVARVFPRAEQEKFAVVRTFQAQMKAAGADDSVGGSAFEAWINSQVMIEGLRRAGRDLTREKLRAGLASIKRLELGDLNLGFAESAPYVASERVEMTVFGDKGRVIS